MDADNNLLVKSLLSTIKQQRIQLNQLKALVNAKHCICEQQSVLLNGNQTTKLPESKPDLKNYSPDHDPLQWIVIHPPNFSNNPINFHSNFMQSQFQNDCSDLVIVIDPMIVSHANLNTFTVALGLGLVDSRNSKQPLINVSLSLQLLADSLCNVRISYNSQILHQLNPGKWMTISSHGHCFGLRIPPTILNQYTQSLQFSCCIHFNNGATLPIPYPLELMFAPPKNDQPDLSRLSLLGLHIQFPHKLSLSYKFPTSSPSNVSSPSDILHYLDPTHDMHITSSNAGPKNNFQGDDLPFGSIHAVDSQSNLSITISVHHVNAISSCSILITGMNMHYVVDKVHQIYTLILHGQGLGGVDDLKINFHSCRESLSLLQTHSTLHGITSMYKDVLQMF